MKRMKLFYVNTTMINVTHNSVQCDRIKHVKVGHHFIKENLKQGSSLYSMCHYRK